jgi:serine/threonine protein kinase
VENHYKIKKIGKFEYCFYFSNINMFAFLVGYGATSVVYKADMVSDSSVTTLDEQKQKSVAIKKVKNVFENEIYAHRILREIRLLRILRGHKNVSRANKCKLIFLIKNRS